MTLTRRSEGVYTDDSRIGELDGIDSVIFDCDGVLIDVTESYDLAIARTAKHVLENFAEISDAINVGSEIIDGFKSTGGFNDEVDLTYAAILSIVAARQTGKDQAGLVFDVIKNSDGIASVERYLQGQADISGIKRRLNYPGTRRDSALYRIFDQLFYGPRLYKKLFGSASEFDGPGLIEQDRVILDDSLAARLQEKFGAKIAMVTGRGRESVRYSLKSLMERFDLANSVFLEDEPRELAKPNPRPLVDSIDGLGCSSTLYVGDSMEDLIMADKAAKMGSKTAFCGIFGTSKAPLEKLELFERNGAILALDSINLLPKVLNLE